MKWHKLSSRQEKAGYKTITYKDFRMPDGSVHEYTTWGKAGTQVVGTIAITKDKQVIIAKQFRAGPEKIMYELPAGVANKKEPLEEAARRELKEETGYETKDELVNLGASYRDAYLNETSNYYLAINCRKTSKQSLDDTEYIKVELISIDELINYAKNAGITDGIAVLMAYDQLQSIK